MNSLSEAFNRARRHSKAEKRQFRNRPKPEFEQDLADEIAEMRAEIRALGEIDAIKAKNPKWAKGEICKQARPLNIRPTAKKPVDVLIRDRVELPRSAELQLETIQSARAPLVNAALKRREMFNFRRSLGERAMFGPEYGFVMILDPA